MAYIRSIGILLSFLIIFFYVLYNAASIYSNIWLSDWSNDNVTVVNGTIDTEQRDMRLGVYGAIGFVQGKLSVLYLIKSHYGRAILFLWSVSLFSRLC